MKNLTILCDFDDVLINFCEVWIELINEQNGTTVTPNDVTDWSITKAFPTLTREQVYKPLYEREIWNRVTPLPGAVEYLSKLLSDGYNVYIVTSSHYKTIEPKISNVLVKYFPFFPIDNIIVANNKQMIRGDVLIDDGVHNLINGVYTGILFTQPHNKSYSDDIIRVNNWREVYECISEM